MTQGREAASCGTAGSWTLRAATRHDLTAARALMVACGLPMDGLEDQFVRHFAIGEFGGQLIGVAGVEVCGSVGLLRSVAVATVWRGVGVATALVRDRIEWARCTGMHSLYLLTTTAEPYFARHGFVAVARDSAPREIRASKEFAQACPESAALMRLTLGIDDSSWVR
jgi:amino-acid N-acetyltransferase